MKKYFLLIIIYLGIFPVMHNRKLILLHINHAHASSSFSDEDGDDGGDPDDPDDPNDPTPPDCSGGYTGDPVTQTSLNGNITTTTNCYEMYDGCGNDLGQSCDVPTQCGIESASIYLSASTGDLGDDVILNATVTTIGGATPLFEFQQSSDGGTSWDDVGNDPNVASFTYTIDESGQNKFRVIVSCSCSITVTSSPATCTIASPCNSTYTVNPSVQLVSYPQGLINEQNQEAPNCVFGVTSPLKVDVTIEACNNGTSWTAVLTGIVGSYYEETTLDGAQEVVTGPGGNTTSSNYCLQMTELNSLGAGYCPPQWYMIEATKAHEDVHAASIDPSLNDELSDITSLFNTLSVPNTGQSESEAISQIMALQDFNTAKTTAFNLWDADYTIEIGTDHNGPTATAEHAVVDPVVTAICAYATSQGWANENNYCALCQPPQ